MKKKTDFYSGVCPAVNKQVNGQYQKHLQVCLGKSAEQGTYRYHIMLNSMKGKSVFLCRKIKFNLRHSVNYLQFIDFKLLTSNYWPQIIGLKFFLSEKFRKTMKSVMISHQLSLSVVHNISNQAP